MGHTLLCVLGLFLLLHCGHTEDKPKPDLTVSPSWLSPEALVTLNCSVQHPSAEWRFYWYKAVPKPSDRSYSYELLPGSTNGTKEDSYIVHGQTYTAGYACRAGRGDPVHYTWYSRPRFVWSGESHPESVKVSPDRVQHFTSESVSLSCDSTKWRVMRFTAAGHLSNCSDWGSVNGSTCSIHKRTNKTAVYWCESRSGRFSNAVNISLRNKDIILVSPVRSVTEGHFLTIGCKLKGWAFKSIICFYRNGDLIQNDTRGELEISAVSKSDEGFYSCRCSGEVSSRSWMSVTLSRSESPSFLLPLIIGLLCGFLLIILLLAWRCYRKSKGRRDEPEESCVYSDVRIGSAAGKSSLAVTEETVYAQVKVGTARGP